MLGVPAVIYFAVAIYFTGHFSFNTYVNGTSADNLTAGEIETKIASGLRDYALKIEARGGIVDWITSEDIKLKLDIDGEFDRALKEQNSFLWPVCLFKETYIETDDIVNYSVDTLDKRIDALKMFLPENEIAPVNAHISEESGDDGFYIVKEDPGQTPIKSEVEKRITDAIDILAPEVIMDDECYKEPEIFEDDATLAELRDNLNTYCRASITYNFGAEKVVVDGTLIKDWCEISGTTVSLNEEKVRQFVKDMSRKYDTFGTSRTILSHSGESVKVSGGDYGWWMDRASEGTQLIEAIKRGDKGERVPVYFQTAASYGDKDYGNSYVEIDLTNQHLWVYKDGAVVLDSDFVSGCVNKRRTTPVGTYGITYKERDATLVGENYSSPVKYWMPFNGNVGMHDASWRSEFGGQLYVTNGSHGCINLPTAKAAKIFDIVEKGEAVFVYGGKTLPEPVAPVETVDPETGETETPAQPAAEGGTEQAQPEGQPAAEAQPAPQPEVQTEAQPEAETESESDSEPEAEAEPEEEDSEEESEEESGEE